MRRMRAPISSLKVLLLVYQDNDVVAPAGPPVKVAAR
jgi:hypothetical protein